MNAEDENTERARQTVKLVAAILMPALLGIFVVVLYRTLAIPPPPRQDEAAIALTNRLHHAAQMSLRDLQLLRQDARQAGHDTEEVDMRIWAASMDHPPVLISVPPPGMDDTWAWALSEDGGYAVATGARTDAAGRRTVGLYDLKADEWVWTNKFVWPTTHEPPHVFNRTLVLRYVKGNAKFALEVSDDGTIASIDPLPPNSAFETVHPPPARPECPGQPVALMHNVFFVTDPSTWHLTGYAHCRLPGLYYAGKGDDHTVFSGNGRLKFRVEGERILVEDSLTQKLLQSFRVDKPSVITGISTTREGDVLTVFVNERSIAKCFAVNLVSGNVKETLGAEKVPQTVEDMAFSRDGRWGFVIENNRGLNELAIITDANSGSHKEIALVPFATLHSPISHLTLLEEERHLVIRSDDDFWLLDLSVARNYASQLDRMAAADYAQAHPEEEDKETAKELEEDDYYGMWLASFTPTPPIAPIALHAEQLVQHQAWFYAVMRFNTCMRYAAMDYRAPRINPLLYARASFLAGQPALGKAICRNVLEQVLLSDRTDYNRMIRYHLQALYFAD